MNEILGLPTGDLSLHLTIRVTAPLLHLAHVTFDNTAWDILDNEIHGRAQSADKMLPLLFPQGPEFHPPPPPSLDTDTL